jgi:hypothetical protein
MRNYLQKALLNVLSLYAATDRSIKGENVLEEGGKRVYLPQMSARSNVLLLKRRGDS